MESVIQSQSKTEKQISHIVHTYGILENCYFWTYLQGRNRDADVEKRLVDMGWIRRRMWDELRESDWHIYTATCKIDMWEIAVEHRELSLVFCGDLERGDWGQWRGGEARERQHLCIHIPDSCSCMSEINATL